MRAPYRTCSAFCPEPAQVFLLPSLPFSRHLPPSQIFLVYPSVSASIFQFFICEAMDKEGEDGSRFLRVDLSINCEGPERLAAYPYAVAVM